ncbi:hypothetical protein [Streptomyces albipurpureus]|uniref:Butirosin biosynthesis protein H-like n=1 Tax=Streptomyces albipurpureus TaxID=2897419 RepID=A0ABT0UXT1_9ACTN|nr:hypothetical protein [Streptomyces sp. CWNU-1]MCM2393269.1 hypothetical protein [Streptomyces sp. CWNU-1]
MISYLGSGPYCYTDSLAMVAGADSVPPTAVIETLTGSPFGFQLIGGTLPLFDPLGWDPELGLDEAVDLLGLRCAHTAGGTPSQAHARLRSACARGPVLAGPVDMGLLLYRPGTPAPGFGDHYVVVLAADDGAVLLHDPNGHPYATLSVSAFLDAWRADTVAYVDEPFVMRSDFVRERKVTAVEALRRSLPRAVAWLSGRGDLPVPPGTLGGAEGVGAFAGLVERGLDQSTRDLLGSFAIRVGARRLSDAAACLSLLELHGPATVAAELSQHIGALQEPLVTHDDRRLLAGLRCLAPGFERLRAALAEALHDGPGPAAESARG